MTDVDSFLMMLNIAAAIASIYNYVIQYFMVKIVFFSVLRIETKLVSKIESIVICGH